MTCQRQVGEPRLLDGYMTIHQVVRDMRGQSRSQSGFTLIETIIVIVLVSMLLTGIVGALALMQRGLTKTRLDTVALNLARSQIESVKHQPYSESTPYPTIASPSDDFSISFTSPTLTSGILQRIDVSVANSGYTTTLSAFNAKQVPPILASAATVETGWKTLASAPAATGIGGAAIAAGQYIYALRGGGTTAFWRFDPFGGTWTVLANTLSAVGSGACLVHDSNIATSNYIFALRGGNTNHFWRYDIDANTWATMAVPPFSVNHGGACTWDGNNTIYAFRGDGTAFFAKYTISTNSWTSLTSAPAALGTGGGNGLAYASGAVYAFRGGGTTTFWRYNISANTWTTTLAQAPAAVGPGRSLTSDGQDVFAFPGNSTDAYWSYRIASNTWDVLGTAPGTVSDGGVLAVLNGIIYALRGASTATFWKIHS